MDMQTTVLLVIGVPLLGVAADPAAWLVQAAEVDGLRLRGVHRRRPRHLSWTLLGPALGGITTHWTLPLYEWASFSLTFDALAAFMAFTASLIATLIAIYSLGYIEHGEDRPEYYFVVTLFLGAMMGLVFSSNLLFLYMFWEISALICWRLIGYFREPDYIWKADKAFLVTFGGAVFMLLGFALFAQYGTFGLAELRGQEIGPIALLLILLGVFSERHGAAAHVAARRRRGALHHHLAAARRHPRQDRPLRLRRIANGMVIPPAWETGILIAALVARSCQPARRCVRPTSSACWLTRRSARSATPSWGYSRVHPLRLHRRAAVHPGPRSRQGRPLPLRRHHRARRTHKDMTKMGGLIQKMPITAFCYIVCALSIAGIPPMAGFFAKYFVISGLVEGGHLHRRPGDLTTGGHADVHAQRLSRLHGGAARRLTTKVRPSWWAWWRAGSAHRRRGGPDASALRTGPCGRWGTPGPGVHLPVEVSHER